jgi:hypothetical protein
MWRWIMRAALSVLPVAVAIALLMRGGAAAAPQCISDEEVELVRARPADAARVFAGCEAEVRDMLEEVSMPTDDDSLRAVFAAALAYRFAPYRPATSLSFAELRADDGLQCQGLALLAGYLYEAAGGASDRLRVVGLDGLTPPVNHVQVSVGEMILDPTTGDVAHVSFADARQGVRAQAILDISDPGRPDSYRDEGGGEAFRETVQAAMTEGRYPDATVLYSYSMADWDSVLAGYGIDREGIRVPTEVPS